MGAIRSGAAAAGGSGGGGEIVQIHGGHILRSTGRKDRHSKIFTAKGPRDRRVRLAAHTAIQFYDVQDRLGYDRPSKAVDWLIQNAKSAIDKLTELPPWQPNPNPTDTHLLETPHEEPESSDFVPETEPIYRVVSSRSQDLGLSLYPNQTSLGPGLGFGFERDELLYSNNSKLWNLDGFGGPVSEDLHHKSIVQQSLFLGGTFGSDGFAGFSLPVHSHDEGEHVGSSRVPSSLYAWSNGGLHSLLKNK